MNKPTDSDLRTQVMEVLKRFKSRAIHVGELRGRVGLDKTDYDLLAGVMDRLADEGTVTELPGGRYRLRRKRDGEPAPSKRKPARPDADAASGEDEAGRERTGSLSVHARGFGFVVVDSGGPDVFVPASRLSTALHGDRVRLRVQRGPKGLDGRVVEVLERRFRHVGGQLHITAAGAYIEADDDRVRLPIHVVGELPEDARTGQGVIAEVVRYPQHPGDGLDVEIVECFEPHEFVAFETRRILLREGAAEDLAPEAIAEAEALPSSVPARDKRDRVDLRELPLVTIDPDDAKDHDDAVWAERLEDGGFRVIVAIADVSHYVQPDSALDLDARTRGCTIYLPGRAIPMLPHAISSNLASLVPNRDRLALAVEADLGPGGAIRGYRLLETVMRSHARLTYAGVARTLGLTEEGTKQPAAERLKPMLETLLEVSRLLGKRRRRRGSLEFDLPEAKVELDTDTGHPLDVMRSRSDPGLRATYKMIEELALLANEVVAGDLSKRKLPTIYRVHPTPDFERLEMFAELATSLGHTIDAEGCQNPRTLERFLARIADTEHAETLGYLLLRAMQQATYSTQNVGHFGLAAKDYLHFTSPIRRYPDLVVHRTVRKLARGERVDVQGASELLEQYAETSSQLERRAMGIEREVVDLYRAMLMQDRVGEVFPGQITGMSENGVFVSLESPYVDVMVRTETMPRDRYTLDPYGIRLTGMYTGAVFKLGDKLHVRIEDVSLARRRVSAVLPEPAKKSDDDRAPAQERGRGQGRERGRRTRPEEGKAREREKHRRSREGRRRETTDPVEPAREGADRSQGPGKRTRKRVRDADGDGAREGGRSRKAHKQRSEAAKVDARKAGNTRGRSGKKRPPKRKAKKG